VCICVGVLGSLAAHFHFSHLANPSIALKYKEDNGSGSNEEDRQKEIRVIEDLLEDVWVWIEHDYDWWDTNFQLELDAEEGDDIKMWFGEVANRHGLE
jgi:hypothetical protein